MKVWIITVGEPIPLDGDYPRLYRSGLLANLLAAREHDVTWWTSSFDHSNKRHRSNRDAVIILNEKLRINLLHALSYRHNISIARIINHFIIAVKFLLWARKEKRPDIIIVSLPTLDLAWAAAIVGKKYGIPVVVDIRDLWPDIFLDVFPARIRFFAQGTLLPYYLMAAYACNNARAIIGLTEPFICWGLERARRARNNADRVFPMGYSEKRPPARALEEAEAFWMDKGIYAGSGDFVVCFFGTMGRHFDIETVISAARIIVQKQLPIKFVLCGTGDRLSHYRCLAEGCINVVFPGWVDAAKIWALMKFASVGLAPYNNTPNFTLNLTNKPIEYLAAGLPIISSLRGILHDLITKNRCGVTYAEGDAENLAEILIDLNRSSGKVRSMSENAARLFKEKFVAEKVYSDMANYLEELSVETSCEKNARPCE